MRHRTLAGTAFAVALAGAGLVVPGGSPGDVRAQVPDRPVRIVVGLPPGSSGDVAARLLAEGMEGALGRTVLVENRPGADGIIAVRQVAAAPPDGTTLLLGLSAQFAVNPVTHANLPYDPVRALTPISLVAIQRMSIAVHPSLPVATPQALVAYAKQHPGSLSYAAGTSSFMLAGEAFKQASGADMLHVPYSGSIAANLALVAGTVQVAFGTAGDTLEHAKAGRIRVLAVSGASRMAELPDVPTFTEAGFDDPIRIWLGMFAPPGIADAEVRRLRGAVLRALEHPRYRDYLARTGQIAIGGTPEGLTDAIVRDMARAADVARKAGVAAPN